MWGVSQAETKKKGEYTLGKTPVPPGAMFSTKKNLQQWSKLKTRLAAVKGGWSIPNFWSGRGPDVDTMEELQRIEDLGIEDGDLVDF